MTTFDPMSQPKYFISKIPGLGLVVSHRHSTVMQARRYRLVLLHYAVIVFANSAQTLCSFEDMTPALDNQACVEHGELFAKTFFWRRQAVACDV